MLQRSRKRRRDSISLSWVVQRAWARAPGEAPERERRADDDDTGD
jgi:hypothetical protein